MLVQSVFPVAPSTASVRGSLYDFVRFSGVKIKDHHFNHANIGSKLPDGHHVEFWEFFIEGVHHTYWGGIIMAGNERTTHGLL